MSAFVSINATQNSKTKKWKRKWTVDRLLTPTDDQNCKHASRQKYFDQNTYLQQRTAGGSMREEFACSICIKHLKENIDKISLLVYH